MTTGRDEALRLDAYLDTPAAELAPPADPDALDADLRRAIDTLRAGLVRVHPSFRFVDELAARLAREADALTAEAALLSAAQPGGELVPFPLTPAAATGARFDRAVLVRGAISTVSLAGVALVAWRIGRGSAAGRRSAVATFLPGGHA